MAKLNLSPPWVVYYRKLSAFFKEDPEVRITYDDIDMFTFCLQFKTAIQKMLIIGSDPVSNFVRSFSEKAC